MKLRAWYVNEKCVLIVDNCDLNNDIWGANPDDWNNVFDAIMIFKDEVELEELDL